MDLEDAAAVQKLFCIVPQEIDLVLLPLQNLLFCREIFVLFSDYAGSGPDVVLFVHYRMRRQRPLHGFLYDGTRLILLTVQDSGGLGNHGEVLCKYRVSSDI